MDWFVILLFISIGLLIVAEGFSFWRIRSLRAQANDQIRWDWSWFIYPWLCVAIVVGMAWYGWGMNGQS
jgi:hypothetical protein